MKKALGLFCLILLFFTVGCKNTEKSRPISTTVPGAVIPFYQNQKDVVIKTKKQPVQVGMLLPLTGKSADIAEDLRNAAMLAQFETTQENYTLSFYDTKGTKEGTKQAFNQAIQEKTQIILGPLFSQEVEAVKSLAKSHKIPVFSFTSDIKNLSNGVYSLALTLQNQTHHIIRFACEKGAKRLAIMAPDNQAGDIAIETAKKTASLCGIDIVKLSVYNPTFINFEPYVLSVLPENFVQIRKEKIAEKKRIRMGQAKKEEEIPEEEKLTVKEQLDFDALFIADDGNRLKSIASLFGLYDVYPQDVLFLGLSTWHEESLSNEGALMGAYFPLLAEESYDAFEQKYEQTYAKKPHRLASLAYDAVALSSFLQEQKTSEALNTLSPSGFIGTNGLFRFSEKGYSEQPMAIYKIAGPKKFIKVQKPSTSFEIEDWKNEQLEDIKIINRYEEEHPYEAENPDEESVSPEHLETISTSQSTDLTSTSPLE
ncbi:MAG: penicillin-binding protein activator [Alphaproteobacteria bacterium]|nr:penicillin-binding protein activator [Alphaproteobacteria bacterium]